MPSGISLLRYALRFAVFFVTNCYGLFAYVMWTTTLLPLRLLWPALYWRFESFIFRGLQTFVIFWMGGGDYGVIESGDDMSKLSEKEVVLLCNHQSTADTPLVMMALWPKDGCLTHSMWIMDSVFRYTNFGIISTIRRDFFIKQGKETRDQQTRQLADHLRDCYLPLGRKWIVLFPEGGFLRKRLESSQRYARKNNYPVLHKVTLPRIGALKVIIDTLGGHHFEDPTNKATNGNSEGRCERPLKWVVDMTIGYRNDEGEPPDMLGMCIGYRRKQDMYVHYRAYQLSAMPRDAEGLTQWLYARYEEKEHMLEHLATHGRFPPDHRPSTLPTLEPRRIMYDWVSVLLFQAFFAASSYLHYSCVVSPLLALVF